MQLKRNKEMEFETLKKSNKKQIIIGALAVCVIGGALTFNLTRAKYKVDGEVDLAKGTVNYSVPDLRVVAIKTSEDGANYNMVDNVPTSGYTLNTEKSVCKVYDGTTSVEESPKDNNITIEYKNEKIYIGELTKRNTRCYLYFDKIKGITIDNIIAGLNSKSTAPNFSQIATKDMGVYSVSDGMYGGTSYYWRGASTTNYVKFANFCWRIVRINGDKTMRLIYDGATCHTNGTKTAENIAVTNQVYNSLYDKSEYVGWTYSIGNQRTTNGTSSNIKNQTDTWYNNNIGNNTAYSNKVADGKFCNDRDTASGYIWSSQPSNTLLYAAYKRFDSVKSPSLTCNNVSDVYKLKAGVITIDEVIMAGASWGVGNSSYYLYNGQYYWTMSPYDSVLENSELKARVFIAYGNGDVGNGYVNFAWGLRPVINLRSDVTFSGGDGTLDNPYVVQ